MGLKRGILIDLAMLFLLGIVGVIYLTLHGEKSIETVPRPVFTSIPTKTSLANPASVNCSQVGGKLIIQKRGDGGEYGLCQFSDNKACEEWALFRKDCPVGGVKTTGDDTIAQRYCTWIGGKTLAETCKLPQGQVCNDDALYNGTCQ
ncbi:MAG TPA: DUF333 domain-containing protein [Candidatus Saccharimonadales bacterium]|nr:DUF333 domain-containing protein [Candidatus Saccharimonadales bacterium]